jgi:hypothetical protein
MLGASTTSHVNPERRTFLAIGGLAAIGAVANVVLKNAVGDLVASGVEKAGSGAIHLFSNLIHGAPKRMPMDADKSDLIYHLFLRAHTNSFFLPADEWELQKADVRLGDGSLTYGHEASVCNMIADFLHVDMKIEYQYSKRQPAFDANVSKVILGSGASNTEARPYLGRPQHPLFDTGFCSLHYGIGAGKRRLKRKQYGRIIEEGEHVLRDRENNHALHPESSGDHLSDDYLLVTQVPGEKKGSVATLFAGLHGPGTRAAELIFFEQSIAQKDLQKLASRIDLRPGEIPYYQAVFRASRFRDGLESDSTNSQVATSLELVEEKFPPVRLKVT